MALLSAEIFEWLATMLNHIENGKPWPEGMQHSKAAYLSKDHKKADDPLAYRVLMVLPAAVRLWGTHRLAHLQPWTEQWGMDEMFAGVGSQGAEDAWYGLAVKMGHLNLLGTEYAGGMVDIAKCFDQINRELVEQLALEAGVPPGLMDAYMRYQNQLSVHNSVAGGIGKGFRRRTGIPQGCPLSMQWMALILRPWIVMQKEAGNIPRVLADDILLLSEGQEKLMHRFAGALDATHTYLIDMGAVVAPDKNSNFASTEAPRKWPRETYWKKLGPAIAVVENFRYLGAHMNIARKNTAETLKQRIKMELS